MHAKKKDATNKRWKKQGSVAAGGHAVEARDGVAHGLEGRLGLSPHGLVDATQTLQALGLGAQAHGDGRGRRPAPVLGGRLVIIIIVVITNTATINMIIV